MWKKIVVEILISVMPNVNAQPQLWRGTIFKLTKAVSVKNIGAHFALNNSTNQNLEPLHHSDAWINFVYFEQDLILEQKALVRLKFLWGDRGGDIFKIPPPDKFCLYPPFKVFWESFLFSYIL